MKNIIKSKWTGRRKKSVFWRTALFLRWLKRGEICSIMSLYGMQELVLNNGNVGFVYRFGATLNKEWTGKGFSSLSEVVSICWLKVFQLWNNIIIVFIVKKALVTLKFTNNRNIKTFKWSFPFVHDCSCRWMTDFFEKLFYTARVGLSQMKTKAKVKDEFSGILYVKSALNITTTRLVIVVTKGTN